MPSDILTLLLFSEEHDMMHCKKKTRLEGRSMMVVIGIMQ
jgi:hypothetical protein